MTDTPEKTMTPEERAEKALRGHMSNSWLQNVEKVTAAIREASEEAEKRGVIQGLLQAHAAIVGDEYESECRNSILCFIQQAELPAEAPASAPAADDPSGAETSGDAPPIP